MRNQVFHLRRSETLPALVIGIESGGMKSI
jgi:hypothetical protein